MIENVSYKRCVCDFCKKEEHIHPLFIRPKEWDKINIKEESYDICNECIVKVDMAIEDLKENKCEELNEDDKPKTNADRIRRMSDEELVELIDNSLDCFDCYKCEYRDKSNCFYGGIYCKDHVLKWLQTEIK